LEPISKERETFSRVGSGIGGTMLFPGQQVDGNMTIRGFFSPFEGFTQYPVPDSKAAYLAYRELAIGVIQARNERIRAWWETHRSG
jgi:hypothetical protein